MFNVEPQETWNAEEKAEFEEHVTARNARLRRAAVLAAALFAFDVACLVPFLDGFPLHSYWNFGKWLLLAAFPLLLWLVAKVGAVWASWQSARETRREFDDA